MEGLPAPLRSGTPVALSSTVRRQPAVQRFSRSQWFECWSLGCTHVRAFALLGAFLRQRSRTRASPTCELHWLQERSPCLTLEQEEALHLMMSEDFNFRQLTSRENKAFRQKVCKTTGLKPDDVSDLFIHSLRRNVQIEAAARFAWRLKDKGLLSTVEKEKKVAKDSDSLALPRLSQELCLPPSVILKRMLQSEDLPKNMKPQTVLRALQDDFSSIAEARKLLVKKVPACDSMSDWMLREFVWVCENDIEAQTERQDQEATEFEDAVAQYCREAGLSLCREEDLRGTSRVTPDVYFSSPVMLSFGTRMESFAWLECKNFHAGSQNKMMLRKLKDQAKRYVEALGPGAVVFAAGATEKVKMALAKFGVAALDGSSIRRSKSQGPRFISGPSAEFWCLPRQSPKPGRKKNTFF